MSHRIQDTLSLGGSLKMKRSKAQRAESQRVEGRLLLMASEIMGSPCPVLVLERGEEQGRTLRLDAVEFQKVWRCECLIESS